MMNTTLFQVKSILCCLLIVSTNPVIATDKDNVLCDPIVSLNPESTTLKKALTQLSRENHFKYSFPVDVDRAIIPPGKMPLSAMVHHLTSDLNSIVSTEKTPECKTPRITEMQILPVGEETLFAYQDRQPETNEIREPLIIQDMDIYAEEVLLKIRKAQVKLMSPEQKKAFRNAKKMAKKRLIEEGLLEPRKTRKNRKEKREKHQES